MTTRVGPSASDEARKGLPECRYGGEPVPRAARNQSFAPWSGPSPNLGSCPARDFFEQLADRERLKVQNLLDLMGERERVFNQQKFRNLRGQVWELKTTASRFTCF